MATSLCWIWEKPIRIAQLAETMIKLHCQRVVQAGGVRPDIKVQITGIRPGEKMYEELFIDDTCEKTAVKKVMSANEVYLSWDVLEPLLVRLRSVLVGTDRLMVKQRLFEIVFHADQKLGEELLLVDDSIVRPTLKVALVHQ